MLLVNYYKKIHRLGRYDSTKKIILRLKLDSPISCGEGVYRKEGGGTSLFREKVIHKLFAVYELSRTANTCY